MDEDFDDVLICLRRQDALFHMSHCKNMMHNFKHYNGKVRISDNKSLKITELVMLSERQP